MILSSVACGSSQDNAGAADNDTEYNEDAEEAYPEEEGSEDESSDEDLTDDDDESYSDDEAYDETEYEESDDFFDDMTDEELYLYLSDEYDDGYWWGCCDENDGSDYSDEMVTDESGTDWSEAQPISSDEEAAAYLSECVNSRMTQIPVYLTNGYTMSIMDFLYITNLPWCECDVYYSDGGEAQMMFKTLYYPGTNIADAYLSGDTSALTADEMKVYEIAVGIVEEANAQPTTLRKELYLHDKICEDVKYYTETLDKKMPRFCTAIGVFLDGKANCQGYSDAFYMLGTMAGFTVGKQSGQANNGGHVWNVIELADNQYAIDVTWDDDTFTLNNYNFVTYKYFNLGADLLSNTHSWKDSSSFNPITETTDGAYFYYTSEADDNYFGQFTTDVNDMVAYSAQRLMAGDPFIYIMGKGFICDGNDVTQAINNTIVANGYSGAFSTNLQTLGNNSYLYVDSAKRN